MITIKQDLDLEKNMEDKIILIENENDIKCNTKEETVKILFLSNLFILTT